MLKEYEDGFVDPETFQKRYNPAKIYTLIEREAEVSKQCYLYIEMPRFRQRIVYQPIFRKLDPSEKQWDTDMTQEEKLLKQFWKETGTGPSPENIHPTAKSYDYLMNLCKLPASWKWNQEQKAVIWKYRYYLRKEPIVLFGLFAALLSFVGLTKIYSHC